MTEAEATQSCTKVKNQKVTGAVNKKLFHLINDESAEEKRAKGVERAGRDTETGIHHDALMIGEMTTLS